jgi:hypothetical protein
MQSCVAMPSIRTTGWSGSARESFPHFLLKNHTGSAASGRSFLPTIKLHSVCQGATSGRPHDAERHRRMSAPGPSGTVKGRNASILFSDIDDWGEWLGRFDIHHEHHDLRPQWLDHRVRSAAGDHQHLECDDRHSGNHYVIRNAAWNATVAAGGAVTAADSWHCRTLVMLRLPPGKPPRLR